MLASELVTIDTQAQGLIDDLSIETARANTISGSSDIRIYDVFGSYVNQAKGAYQGVNVFNDSGSLNLQGYRVCVSFLWDAYIHGGTNRAFTRASQAFVGLGPRTLEFYDEPRWKLTFDSGSLSTVTGSVLQDYSKQWHPTDTWKNSLTFLTSGAYASGSAFVDESYRDTVTSHARNWGSSGVLPGDGYILTHSKIGVTTKLYSEASRAFGAQVNVWIPTYPPGSYGGLIQVATGSYSFDWLIRGINTAIYNSAPAHMRPAIQYHDTYTIIASMEGLKSGSYSQDDLDEGTGYLYNKVEITGSTYESAVLDLGAGYQGPPKWYYDWTIWTRPDEGSVVYTIDARHANDTGSLATAEWQRLSERNEFVSNDNRLRYMQYRVIADANVDDSIRLYAFGLKGESGMDVDPDILYMTNDIVY